MKFTYTVGEKHQQWRNTNCLCQKIFNVKAVH